MLNSILHITTEQLSVQSDHSELTRRFGRDLWLHVEGNYPKRDSDAPGALLRLYKYAQEPLNEAKAKYRQEHEGVDIEDIVRRDLAAKDSRWLCILPHQQQPLAAITPDVHQNAEVGVRTRKACWWRLLCSIDIADPRLMKTHTFQKKLFEQLRERQENKQDLRMAVRSLQKLNNLLHILERPRDETVECRYVFGKNRRGGRPQYVHYTPGTDGEWTNDSKWR